MLLRVLAFWCVLVLGGSLPGLAQQPTGPATLEGLVNSAEAQGPAADAGPKRPAGTVARPKGGVQHPDLDKAWADYDAAVAEAAESLKAAITEQFDEATAKGDLGSAEKWQAALERFAKAGELPAFSEAPAAVNTVNRGCKKARDELAKAYEAVVKALTMVKQIEKAKATRDEWATLSEGKKAPTLADMLRDHRYRKAIISPTGERQEPNDVFTFTEEGDVLINGKASLKWQPFGQDGIRIDIGSPHGFVELQMGPDGTLTGENTGRSDGDVWLWELRP